MEERQRRKLAVILHADVVGSTTLVHQSETLAHQRIQDSFRRLSEAIKAYGGSTHELRGDALVAEFSRASDAVCAALSFQQEHTASLLALRDDIKPTIRIGISLGEVVFADNTVTGGGVVLAQRVEQLAEPGGICITAAIHEALPQHMPFDQYDLGEQEVKGFDEPIRVYRVALKSGEVVPPPEKAEKLKSTNALGISAAIVAMILVVAGGIAVWLEPWQPEEEPASMERMAFPLPEKPSIAVLPFSNLSGDPDQEYLADGLTEEIITTLSKSPYLFVIARNSTFTYKGKPVEVKQVAEEQGVRYVLEGSVQLSGDRIRINAQLIDALEGHHIWAERYDREFNDIFALQDDITQNIMIALEVELTHGEEVRLMHARAPDPEAFLYVQKSRVHYYRFNKQDNAIARELATKATEISPEYPDAWEWLGWYTFNDYRFGWGADRQKSFKQAEAVADKAYKLDPTVSGVNGLLGALSLYRGDYDQAVAHYRKAVELAPSNAIMIGGLAWVLVYSGYPKEAIPLLQQAMRLSPYYPAWIVGTLGLAYMMTGDYPKAIAANQQMIERKSLLQFGYSRLAAIHAVLGDDEKAKTYAAELLKINPDFNLSSWSNVLIYRDQEALDWELEGLRMAGLPENRPLKLPDKPSIAVLPFSNISEDKSQDYFADGMTEDLITDLSKISGLFVIARNSSFAYKGQEVKVRQVAEELGVRYVLEGSVRRAGDTLRINSQLIDATTGGHIWAERYDGDLDDVFRLQDRISASIVSVLAVTLTEDEERKADQGGTDNVAAYDAFLQGWEHLQRHTAEEFTHALPSLKKAVELDPTYGRAYAALAWIYYQASQRRWHESLGLAERRDALDLAYTYQAKALAYPTVLAHRVQTDILWQQEHRFEDAVTEAKRGIALDPGDPTNHAGLARALIHAGRPTEAVAEIETAMRLDPHYPPYYLYILGFARFVAQDYEEAAVALARALERNPGFVFAALPQAAAYAYMGREEEARAARDRFLSVLNKSTVKNISPHWPFMREEDKRHFLEGLEKAGFRP